MYSSSKLAGVIVGCLIGFIAIAAAISVVWCRIRRRKKELYVDTSPFISHDSYGPEPLTPTESCSESPLSTCMSRTILTDYPSITAPTTHVTASGIYAYELPP